MNKQAGFTLVELIAVIVILGILAATALPRFVNMSEAAEQAAVDGVAGNLGSAMAMNYAAAVASEAGVVGGPTPTTVTTCANGSDLIIGNLPTGYAISGTFATTTLGSPTSCTLTFKGKTATFQGIYVPAP